MASRFASRHDRGAGQIGFDHYEPITYIPSSGSSVLITKAIVGDWQQEEVELPNQMGAVNRQVRFVQFCIDPSMREYSGQGTIKRTSKIQIGSDVIAIEDFTIDSTGWVEIKLAKDVLETLGKNQFGRR